MIIEVKIPVVGESISEGFLVEWKKSDGDFVNIDDELFELETDKITLTVQAEQAGKLKIDIPGESDVEIGQVVGSIDTDAQGQPAEEKVEDTAPPINAPAGAQQVAQTLQSPEELDKLSPAVRRLVSEMKLDPEKITGTGKDGRITKEDVLKYKEAEKPAVAPKVEVIKESPKTLTIPSEPKAEKAEVKAPVQKVASAAEVQARQERKPMSRLRQRLSERLVSSQNNTATLTTFNEVDLSRVMEMRAKYKDTFLDKYGVKLGFMSFFVKATIEALKKIPAVNAQIDGNDIIYNNYYDIGVAVSTDNGLVVPVIRDADKLGFGEIEQVIADLGKRARERKLTIDDLQGGTFSISNGGIFGSMMSTPILNPPQSGILGMHAIKKRPVVIEPEGKIEVRPMMYLALSYDHRIIDGAESVTFLKHIVECLENPEKMMFGVC